jgi:hypothetical protein
VSRRGCLVSGRCRHGAGDVGTGIAGSVAHGKKKQIDAKHPHRIVLYKIVP